MKASHDGLLNGVAYAASQAKQQHFLGDELPTLLNSIGRRLVLKQRAEGLFVGLPRLHNQMMTISPISKRQSN